MHAGLAARVRGDLSDDPRRKPGEAELDVAAGPLAVVAIGPFAVFAQAGLSAARIDGPMETGPPRRRRRGRELLTS
jgi:hypothetical protein